MSPLPAPDPAAGNAAEVAAAGARKAVLEAVTAGTVTVEDVFTQVDAETGHHTLGHIHVRALLEALPHIGDAKSAEILDGLKIAHDEHLDVLGTAERSSLIAAISAA